MFNIFKVDPEFMPKIPSMGIGHALAWIVAALVITGVAFVCLTSFVL